MRSLSLAALALLSLSAVPGAALACGGGDDMTTLGSAAFTADGRIRVMAVRKHGYQWLTMEKDGTIAEELGHLGVHHTYGNPRMRTGGAGALAQIDWTLFQEHGADHDADELLTNVIAFDAVPGDSPAIAASVIEPEGGLVQLAILTPGVKGALTERGRLDITGACTDHLIAVARVGGTVTGLCGDVPFRLDGDTISLEPSLGLGSLSDVRFAGMADDGSAVFFAALPSTEASTMQLAEVRRSAGGAWTAQPIADVPAGYGFPGGLAAADENGGAVLGFEGYGETASLFAFFRAGGAWQVESVGYVSAHDQVSAHPVDGGAPRILAGSYDLNHYERDDQGVWTHTALPQIGKFFPGDMGGCSVSSTRGAPSIGAALLASLAFASLITRRRTA